MKSLKRCHWCEGDPLYERYHDEEWGQPLFDDLKLFEFLCLEGAQAGLSWITILKKRESYKKAFDGFAPKKIASYNNRKVESLLKDSGIVRNRMKVNAFIKNAKACLMMKDQGLSFSEYFWDYVDGEPIKNKWKSSSQVPSQTELSVKISRDLKSRGFSFVGPTIIYAFMQATGIVNDHLVSCFRYGEV